MQLHIIKEMGCSSSINIVYNVVVPAETLNKEKCLAGKFRRTQLPKEIWLRRMYSFICKHILQFKDYSAYDIDVMLNKLNQYMKSISDNETKHAKAIIILNDIFCKAPSPAMLRVALREMSVSYCSQDKEHEFEEIAFVFSIIVTAPILGLYETN